MPLPVAKMAITAGLMVANMALTMTRKIEGPRLDDLKFTGGDYGAPLPMIWGTRRQEGQIFWAEDLKEVKRRRKTKGGKYNDYSYYGTWAVAIAGHEISAVTRIWFDTHLVFDLTGAGPVTPFDFGGEIWDRFRQIRTSRELSGRPPAAGAKGTRKYDSLLSIYLGTATQNPDPRMEATVEAEFGEGFCPAYRDTAYIVFKDVPLEKFGNRIPQVSVEVVSNASPAYPYETFDTIADQPNRLWGATFSTDYSRFMWANNDDTFEIWDVAARARMVSGTFGAELNLTSRFGMYADGHFLAMSSDNQDLISIAADGFSTSIIQSFAFPAELQDEVRVLAAGNGDEHWMTIPWSNVDVFYVDGVQKDMADLTGTAWIPYEYFVHEDGSIWAVGRTIGTGETTAYFYRVIGGGDGPGFFSVTGLPSIGIALGNISGAYAQGAFILAWSPSAGDDCLYRLDQDGTILVSRTDLSFDVYNWTKQFANLPPGSSSIWLDEAEISLADLTTLRTIDTADWTSQDADGIIYDPINHALWTAPQFDQELNILYLDRAGGEGVTLGVIAADIAEMVGVEDYDFTALNQVVTGWSATQGAATNMLEPLLDVYDSDVRPHNFSLQGVKRHGVSDGTLLTERFVGDPRYTVTVRQGAELPRSANINFADINADQQPNNVLVTRPLDATGARGEMPIDLSTLALDADEARGLADRHFRRLWNERSEVSLGLTAQQLALEPGDVRTLDLDGETMAARLVRLTVSADDSLQTEWRYDHSSLAILTTDAGATFDGRNPSVITVPLISKGFVLDIPLLEDSDNSANPVLYMAAAPYADGTWPGATIYEAVDGEYSEEAANVASSAPAAWGYATEVLPDANPWLWDRGSSVNVKLQVGTLAGCTEAAINADPTLNLCLLGDELLNFTTATLEMDGSYTLSGFKRGRRGTEWATGTHAERDVFLLLDTADDVEQGLSEVGTDLTFKAVTASRTEAGSFPIPVSFTGASLKPYAPAHLEAVKETNGDWTLTWVRRTRVGGAWTSGTSIPLSEASEEYELDLSDGVDTVTKVVISATTYTWLVADQITDVGAEVMAGDLDWSVFQISDAVDRGFEASATS